MSLAFAIKNPCNQAWSPSPTGAEGCFSKKLFEYGEEKLGRDGRAVSYTTLYRFEPGSQYPAWQMVDGACEIWVLEGALEVNGKSVEAGEWAQLLPNGNNWTLGSSNGCQVLAIVRGQIQLVSQL